MAKCGLGGSVMPAQIALSNLTLAYQGHPAVHHVSGAFEPGSLTAIVGPNGAGKTTLLSAIMGMIRPSEGEVRLQQGLSGRIAWLPQQAAIDRTFPIRVFDLVALGHWSKLGSFKAITHAQTQEVKRALEVVGLKNFERRGINELSAGQFQRVLFARVILQDAPVILLDEPFNAIDARTTSDLLKIVSNWHAQSKTVVAVLHDIELVRANFPQTLLLARRCVAWGPTEQILTAANLFRARQMAEAWNDDAPVCTQAA